MNEQHSHLEIQWQVAAGKNGDPALWGTVCGHEYQQNEVKEAFAALTELARTTDHRYRLLNVVTTVIAEVQNGSL